MRNLHALLLVFAFGLAAAQAPAEVRDPTVSMLGPLIGLSAETLAIDVSEDLERVHMVAVLDSTLIHEHDRDLTVHTDRPVSALVTMAAYAGPEDSCPMQTLLGSQLVDEGDYVFQHGYGIACIPDAEVTRRVTATSTPESLRPGRSALDLPYDEWLTVSAVRFSDEVPHAEEPLNGLIVFYLYLSSDGDAAPPAAPGTSPD